MKTKMAKIGDTVKCQGITAIIAVIISQEPWEWRNGYFVEFYDSTNRYRVWDQVQDGGELIQK